MNWDQDQLRELSEEAFRNFGAPNAVYVKPLARSGGSEYALHLANGIQVTVLDSEAEALATAHYNDLVPYALH